MELGTQQEQATFDKELVSQGGSEDYQRGARDGWLAARRYFLREFAARLKGGLGYAGEQIKAVARSADMAPPSTWHPGLEWDRPGVGLYSDGQIRIIERREPDGSIGACRMASSEEVRWVLLMEQIASQAPDIARTHQEADAAAVARLQEISRLLLGQYDELRGERPPAVEFELLRMALAPFDSKQT